MFLREYSDLFLFSSSLQAYWGAHLTSGWQGEQTLSCLRLLPSSMVMLPSPAAFGPFSLWGTFACSLGSPGLEVPPRDSASLHFLCCHCSFFLSLGVSDTFILRFFRMTSPMLYGFYLFVFPGKTLALHIFHDAGGTCYIPSVPPNHQA